MKRRDHLKQNLFSGKFITDPNQAPAKEVIPIASLQKILNYLKSICSKVAAVTARGPVPPSAPSSCTHIGVGNGDHRRCPLALVGGSSSKEATLVGAVSGVPLPLIDDDEEDDSKDDKDDDDVDKGDYDDDNGRDDDNGDNNDDMMLSCP
ncbi:hypothetical protein CK203_074725 [Vitis vinifera]|uniref:Uncharacterized protein n=1 Tax=Vitis vinifera TaxID=29760 RepID=A0A438DLU5_VITVI|nr:hypothetical protein CK203_074725 [Vitis vinifera]